MAAMVSLQSSFTSLSLSSNSFLGQRFFPSTSISQVKTVDLPPCLIVMRIEAPIHSSNVMLYSKEKEVASRVGHKVLDDGRKVRYLIKTGEIVDSSEKWKEIQSKKETETAVVATAS